MLFARALIGELSGRELADRVALRELVDAYAFCADRRDAARQMALFTDGRWFFSQRKLMVDWTETRLLGTG